jgi:hypothetical protein
MAEFCVNDYAEPPEGIPVWCVDAGVNLESGIQLVGELIILGLLWILVGKLKRFLIRRKRQKQAAKSPLTHPAASYINIEIPKKP